MPERAVRRRAPRAAPRPRCTSSVSGSCARGARQVEQAGDVALDQPLGEAEAVERADRRGLAPVARRLAARAAAGSGTRGGRVATLASARHASPRCAPRRGRSRAGRSRRRVIVAADRPRSTRRNVRYASIAASRLVALRQSCRSARAPRALGRGPSEQLVRGGEGRLGAGRAAEHLGQLVAPLARRRAARSRSRCGRRARPSRCAGARRRTRRSAAGA